MDVYGCLWFMVSILNVVYKPTYLVGGFKDFLMFHFILWGCHPNPIDFHSIIFQDGEFLHHQAGWFMALKKRVF